MGRIIQGNFFLGHGDFVSNQESERSPPTPAKFPSAVNRGDRVPLKAREALNATVAFKHQHEQNFRICKFPFNGLSTTERDVSHRIQHTRYSYSGVDGTSWFCVQVDFEHQEQEQTRTPTRDETRFWCLFRDIATQSTLSRLSHKPMEILN